MRTYTNVAFSYEERALLETVASFADDIPAGDGRPLSTLLRGLQDAPHLDLLQAAHTGLQALAAKLQPMTTPEYWAAIWQPGPGLVPDPDATRAGLAESMRRNVDAVAAALLLVDEAARLVTPRPSAEDVAVMDQDDADGQTR